MSYAEAIEIAKGLQDLDGPNVNPVCHTRLYTHGQQTERALVLLHGFTNCPRQFDDVGKDFFARGWNVLIPRYPRHGYTNRLNTAIAELRADHLVAVANRSVDAGFGLGARLTVAGLSLGAALAGYMAQTRGGIDRTVMIAPMFGLKPIPGPLLSAASRLAYVLPNFYLWWNWRLKDKIGPPHGYPRLSTRAYAALFEVGRRLFNEARKAAPKSEPITVITNAAEPRLDNRFTYQLIDLWRQLGTHVETFEFPLSNGLPHDLIDPVSNPSGVTDVSYPVLKRFIEGART
jgi:pimeloyl-ACP methyl ester carboxylesterase